MQSVRAYNLNLKELIHPEQSRNPVRDQSVVTNDNQKSPKIDKEVINLFNAKDDGGVFIDISPVWKRASQKIDLRRATMSEVADLSAALFNEGAITFEDHINLSFHKDPFSTDKTDIIAYWNEQQERVIERGAMHDELNDIIRIQSILSYVDSLR